jgi:hypothetical protein
LSNLYPHGHSFEIQVDDTTSALFNGLHDHLRTPGAIDFGWALHRLAWHPDYTAAFRDMLIFYGEYERVGVIEAAHAMSEAAGVPVGVILTETDLDDSEQSIVQGRLLGIVEEGDRRGTFMGVAAVERTSGAAAELAEVFISLDYPDHVMYAYPIEPNTPSTVLQ